MLDDFLPAVRDRAFKVFRHKLFRVLGQPEPRHKHKLAFPVGGVTSVRNQTACICVASYRKTLSAPRRNPLARRCHISFLWADDAKTSLIGPVRVALSFAPNEHSWSSCAGFFDTSLETPLTNPAFHTAPPLAPAYPSVTRSTEPHPQPPTEGMRHVHRPAHRPPGTRRARCR